MLGDSLTGSTAGTLTLTQIVRLIRDAHSKGEVENAYNILDKYSDTMNSCNWEDITPGDLEDLYYAEINVRPSPRIVLCFSLWLKREPDLVWWHSKFGRLVQSKYSSALKNEFCLALAGLTRGDRASGLDAPLANEAKSVIGLFFFSSGDYGRAVTAVMCNERQTELDKSVLSHALQALRNQERAFRVSSTVEKKPGTVPYIIIHTGSQDYLKCAVMRASISNNGEVVHVGSSQLEDVGSHIFLEISQFMRSAQEFAGRYAHHAVTNLSYELFCFQRWFILLDVMEHLGVNSCVCIDSDVLAFCPAKHIVDKLTEGRQIFDCAWTTPIRSIDGLRDFTSFLSSIYSNGIDHLTSILNRFAGRPSPDVITFQDMHAFHAYYVVHASKAMHLPVQENHLGIDHNINVPRDLESEAYSELVSRILLHPTKRILWYEGVPCTIDRKMRLLRAQETLHFQGVSKLLMPLYMFSENTS